MAYILSIDQGTTSSRAIIFDQNGNSVSMAQKEHRQYYPQPGWVEHDPQEIWNGLVSVIKEALAKIQLTANQINALGITNQRETTVVWNKRTGEVLHHAIVWQDRRTAALCESLKNQPIGEYIRQNTGLVIDAYFSATKLRWLLDRYPEAHEKAQAGDLIFGTMDTWLIWKLTGGKIHATDYSNASRTMLFNINTLQWDTKILSALEIPQNMLPEVRSSNAFYGMTDASLFGVEIPIAGVAGDQQAALFGQCCFEIGMMKNTYGTGCFLLKNIGEKPSFSDSGILTTIAWGLDEKITYALEGSVFVAGAAVQWLRDGLGIIDEAADTAYFAQKVSSSEGIYVIPAFTGLAAPYWDMYARAAIVGMTLGTTKNHIIRATLEAIAYQNKDVIDLMVKTSGLPIKTMRVDGGMANNHFLMQCQADILGVEVQRPYQIETTARGAAFLAGIGTGIWTKEAIQDLSIIEQAFIPKIAEHQRRFLYQGWQNAVNQVLTQK